MRLWGCLLMGIIAVAHIAAAMALKEIALLICGEMWLTSTALTIMMDAR